MWRFADGFTAVYTEGLSAAAVVDFDGVFQWAILSPACRNCT